MDGSSLAAKLRPSQPTQGSTRFDRRMPVTHSKSSRPKKLTYQGVADFLTSSPELCDAIGLKTLPHKSRLKRFADRSAVAEIADAMFAEIIQECAPNV